MLTPRKIGTPITVCGGKSSVITIYAGSVPMTNKPSQFVHLNPIPVWSLAKEVTSRGKCLQV